MRKLNHETVAVNSKCMLGETRIECEKRVSMETEKNLGHPTEIQMEFRRKLPNCSISKYCNDCIVELEIFVSKVICLEKKVVLVPLPLALNLPKAKSIHSTSTVKL